MTFDTATGNVEVLVEATGTVFYGAFPGVAPNTAWVVSRPHNWHPTSSQEHLLLIHLLSGRELRRVTVPSRWAHDAVRSGSDVYLCSTQSGEVLHYTLPRMKLASRHRLFSAAQHVNSLAPLAQDGTLWAMLHNQKHPSEIVRVDLRTDTITSRYARRVGSGAHCLVEVAPDQLLYLSSNDGQLRLLDARTSGTRLVYAHPTPGTFLKGLLVMNGVAYFGSSPATQREHRANLDSNCALNAFDLATGSLLWARPLPTHGLLNGISAPTAAVDSSYRAVGRTVHVRFPSDGGGGGQQQRTGDAPAPVRFVNVASTPLQDMPLMIGGRWQSGLSRLSLSAKVAQPEATGLMLPYPPADVTPLLEYLGELPPDVWEDAHQRTHNAVMDGREAFMDRFKPGCKTIYYVFSDGADEVDTVFEFPMYAALRPVVEPVLRAVLGDDILNLARLQLARMDPGVEIKQHRDTGGYSQHTHRIHVVVATNPGVTFSSCRLRKGPDGAAQDCVPLEYDTGSVFEINNRLPHSVVNQGEAPRIHLIADVAETRRIPVLLAPGTACFYDRLTLTCPPGSMTHSDGTVT